MADIRKLYAPEENKDLINQRKVLVLWLRIEVEGNVKEEGCMQSSSSLYLFAIL